MESPTPACGFHRRRSGCGRHRRPDDAAHEQPRPAVQDQGPIRGEAEPLYRRALAIDDQSYGPEHPTVARDLNNLAQLLKATNRLEAAEPLMRRALEIDERSYGPEQPEVARDLNNLALLLKATDRLEEAEPLSRRMLGILLNFTRRTGHPHPHINTALANFKAILKALGRSEAEIAARLGALLGEYGIESSQ